MENETPQIVETVVPITVETLSGYPEGTVLPTGEVVKGTYDEQGKLIGWHKESVGGVQ